MATTTTPIKKEQSNGVSKKHQKKHERSCV